MEFRKCDIDQDCESVDTNEALAEMLGFTIQDSENYWQDEEEPENDNTNHDLSLPIFPLLRLEHILHQDDAYKRYNEQGVYTFPREFSLSPLLLHRLTEEIRLAPLDSKEYGDRTFETIQGVRTLTRLENFVPDEPSSDKTTWFDVCHDYVGHQLVSTLCQQPMVLYKEKLNFKPPKGGKGFAPHLDGPSLRVLYQEGQGPHTFVTIMIAIDKMTKQNGCLRVVRGSWSQDRHVPLEEYVKEGNPDGDGRAGAIPLHVADSMCFEDIECDVGTIVAFNAWVPHRSSANYSEMQRRAIFLTYNPAAEGDYRKYYYEQMTRMRDAYRTANSHIKQIDIQNDLDALTTIPK